MLSVDLTGEVRAEVFFILVKKFINSLTRVFKVYRGGLDGRT